jgi:hypothetical protein
VLYRRSISFGGKPTAAVLRRGRQHRNWNLTKTIREAMRVYRYLPDQTPERGRLELVEVDLPKLDVAGSNPVSRSKIP